MRKTIFAISEGADVQKHPFFSVSAEAGDSADDVGKIVTLNFHQEANAKACLKEIKDKGSFGGKALKAETAAMGKNFYGDDEVDSISFEDKD